MLGGFQSHLDFSALIWLVANDSVPMLSFPRSALLWLVLASTAIADDVTLRGLKPGTYTLEVSAAGVVTLTPTKLVTVGVPNPNPPPVDPLTPFESAIRTLTKSALTNEGGSLTTGAALSEVYSRV